MPYGSHTTIRKHLDALSNEIDFLCLSMKAFYNKIKTSLLSWQYSQKTFNFVTYWFCFVELLGTYNKRLLKCQEKG